jgi:beta-lactamase class A
MVPRLRCSTAALVLAIVAAPLLHAQSGSPAAAQQPPIKTGVNFVRVDV